SNISRTKRIAISGVEIEVYEDIIQVEDTGAYAVISLLKREELILILELGDATFYRNSKSDYFSEQIRPLLENLQNSGLVSVEYNVVSPQGINGDVRIKLTDLGLRVYDELQTLLLSLLKELPSETRE
ncbi:MAG: hypothetical protein AAFY17_11015, partial [Cyanobacteria bacterium J06642_11]